MSPTIGVSGAIPIRIAPAISIRACTKSPDRAVSRRCAAGIGGDCRDPPSGRRLASIDIRFTRAPDRTPVDQSRAIDAPTSCVRFVSCRRHRKNRWRFQLIRSSIVNARLQRFCAGCAERNTDAHGGNRRPCPGMSLFAVELAPSLQQEVHAPRMRFHAAKQHADLLNRGLGMSKDGIDAVDLRVRI